MQDKRTIGDLFNRIAAKYDRFNHISSCYMDVVWRKRAVWAMKPSDRVLDVAVGTADFAIEMLQQDKAQHVTGIDLSEEMIRIGAYKAEQRGLSAQMDLQIANAQQMPMSDESYDALTCSFGIRNFADLDAGLSEFHRVLKTGGQLVIMEFSHPQNPIVKALYNLYFKHIMTRIGAALTDSRADFEYFYNSVKHFIWGDEMVARLEKHGFKNVRYKTMTMGIATLYVAEK